MDYFDWTQYLYSIIRYTLNWEIFVFVNFDINLHNKAGK